MGKKCDKVCEFKGHRSDVSVTFTSTNGSFVDTIHLRDIKKILLLFAWEPNSNIVITAGATSLSFTASGWSLPCQYQGCVPFTLTQPFFYSTNGTSATSFGIGRLTFSGTSPIFTFPLIPADATQISLFGGEIVWPL